MNSVVTLPTQSVPGNAALLEEVRPSEALHPILRGCLEAGARCLSVASMLSPETYVAMAAGHSPIGAHLRHCYDHFETLLWGLERGEIDYDSRNRDPRVEACPDYFQEKLHSRLAQIATFDETALDEAVSIRALVAPDAPPVRFMSTLSRELVYLTSHTIHHLAIIKLTAEQLGIELPDGFGVAYSTAAYWKQASPEAPSSCAR